jgi:AGZA family xanthine/uracil permease-like MFS transporter
MHGEAVGGGGGFGVTPGLALAYAVAGAGLFKFGATRCPIPNAEPPLAVAAE